MSGALAGRFPTLARHWGVLAEAWKLQNEVDGQRKPISDHEFLPAALEIIEKPPSPGLRWLLMALCSLFAIAILWAIVGKLDVVAVASGKVVPAASVKTIQPLEIGVVRAIHVRDGQHVNAGQLLIELDPTMTGAEEAQAGRGLLAAEVVAARNNTLINYLAGHAPTFVPPSGTPAETVTVQHQLIAAQIAEYEAKRAGLVQARAEQAADLVGAEAEIAKLKETLPLVEEQLEARRGLVEKGYFSRLKLLEYEQLRVEHIKNIDVQRATATKARAAIANFDSQLAELRQTLAKGAATELAEAGDNASLRSEELRKTAQRKVFQALGAPVSGTVQQLSIHTIGGVVQPAQTLLVIVPDDSELEVEARLLNRDIGFVREGQTVRVKLEAFPFTDYGLIEGRVVSVSRDAMQDEKLGLVYAARIRLECDRASGAMRLHDQRDLCRRVQAGMSVQAEIRTGSRRIIQYLLSPITSRVDEAGRER